MNKPRLTITLLLFTISLMVTAQSMTYNHDPVVMNQFQLRELIRQTLFSISPNDANKIMTGENLQIHENDLC